MSEDIALIYDRNGQPRLLLMAGGRLVDFNGKSIGFLDSINAYSYGGRHCGWYEDGILRDHSGDCAGFSDLVNDTIHPLLPLKKVRPIPGLIEVEPPRPEIKISPPSPLKTVNWSEHTPASLFTKAPIRL